MAKATAEKPAKASAKAEKPLSKTELLAAIAEETELTKKDVDKVLDALGENIKKSLGKNGSGKFVLPGLVKIEKINIPAKPARKHVPNPFKPGEFMDVPAKKATTKVKVRPLKALKDA
ncbi:DNA-binding protein [Planctomycetales bacterium]|nr:HU family DNA-binding protein [Planctomycetota bacterium]GHS92100.1 DNA-binding protein [Planctomycetales bacterium]GHT05490.1 DNA-binding protein [Planctomycetales bacterium]GHV20109.1 DNA-binding protein [Planctomycetales bacterium]